MNARKAVEPVCLDILLKWRGDEETGRDQMDEILKEVVIITDSEGEEESSDDDEEEAEDESSDEDGEVTSSSSVEGSVEIISRTEPRTSQVQRPTATGNGSSQGRAQASRMLPAQTDGRDRVLRDRNLQKGFKRYQAAFDEAKSRQKMPDMGSAQYQGRAPAANMMNVRPTATSNFTSYHNPQINGSSKPQYPVEYSGNEPRSNGSQSVS